MIMRYTLRGLPKGNRADTKADTAAKSKAKPMAILFPKISPAYPIVNWPVIDPMKTVAVARLLTHGATQCNTTYCM